MVKFQLQLAERKKVLKFPQRIDPQQTVGY
jgi:hypothetical protein